MTEIVNSPHFGFILAAYAVTFVVVAGMIGAVLVDHHALKRALERLSKRAGAAEEEER